MEKELRKCLHASAEDFLLKAVKLDPRIAKSTLKTLIYSMNPSSPLSSSLPQSLHIFISHSLNSFKNPEQTVSHNGSPKSSRSPPTKKLRRSSRNKKNIEESENGQVQNPGVQERQVFSKNLLVYAYIVNSCISHPKKVFSPLDLLPSAEALHDSLIIFEEDAVLSSEIAGLCEQWWKEELPGRENLISQSLPFLLSKSLTLGKKVDVHRVYALREALGLFEFNDDSIEDLKLLLVRCVITPLYLKTEEGRRFIAFLFGLNYQLLKEVLAIIRSQIPFGRKSMLEAYADIIFRAWKVAEGDSLEEIENEFLQSLIEGSVHANSSMLAASIRRVLGGFINQRTTDGVEKLLFRLVEPVLFRSLQVANSNVRHNALHLLLDMFPLEDPQAKKDVKDALLDKQFFLLERLLVDECPDVRVVAVEGCCRILRLFWEVIPSSAITKLLARVVGDMSHDFCSVVRLSTLNGIIYLLENPQAHEILKVLLPRLRHMLVDAVLSVRMVATDLLLAIRDIRTFQFNKVVSLDALLTALASDHPLVAQKITRLLIPSYFPSKLTLKEACSRCVALIRRSPTAGARFCEFIKAEGLPSDSLIELVRVFIGLALSSNGFSPDQIDGLLIAAANLCQNLSNEASCRETLNELFSGKKLKCLLTAASSERARTSVLSIGSVISQDNVSCLLEDCMVLILNPSGLSENMERQAEVRAAHKLMLSCGRFGDLFKALTHRLQMTASRFQMNLGSEIPKQSMPCIKRKKVKLSVKTSMKLNNPSGKRLSKSGVDCVKEDYVVAAAAAAWQIKDLLVSVENRSAVLNSPLLELALSSLKVISLMNIENCMRSESLDASPVLAYTALSMHMSLQNADMADTTDLYNDNNDSFHSEKPPSEQTVLDHCLDHLLNCTKKLFDTTHPGRSSNSSLKAKQGEEKMAARHSSKHREALEDVPDTTEEGAEVNHNFPEAKRISNIVKMVTMVLKFIIDATSMRLVSDCHLRVLQFVSEFIRYIVSVLEMKPDCSSFFKEEDARETFMSLRSSTSHAAKLLNVVLKDFSESSVPHSEISYLANDLLNLVTSIESHLGSRHAAYILAALKPWLPDLILALGSRYVWMKAGQGRGFSEPSGIVHHRNCSLPTWLAVLSRVEICELNQISHDEQKDKDPVTEVFSVFKKLMETVVLLLKKGKSIILDAFGVIILSGAMVGVERTDFELVLGLVHFVCMKLAGDEYDEWNELELMPSSLKQTFSQLERGTTDPKISQDGRQKLERAKTLLESVGLLDL